MNQTVQALINAVAGKTLITNKYVASLLLLVASFIIAQIVYFALRKYLEKIAKKTKSDFDDILLEHIKRPIYYLVLAYGFKLAILNLQLDSFATKLVNSVMAVVTVLIVIRALDVIVETWGLTLAKKTKTNLDEVLLPIFHKVLKVVFIFISFLWILKVWEVNITPYLAGVGLSGLVLGLALQDSLKNIFGGVSLILDKAFQIGDKVKLESGDIGTIHSIGLRSTKLVTYDHEVIYVPNGYLANSRVQNFTHPSPKVRVRVDFGVEYGSDVDKVKKIVLDVIKKTQGVMSDPAPAIFFVEMGDFALKFSTTFWVPHWDQAYSKKAEAVEGVYKAFKKAKIVIPFPTQTIQVKK